MKKLNFKYPLILALCLAISVLSCRADLSEEPGKISYGISVPNKKGMTVKGMITDNLNKPVQGVVVNDGFNFTVTDSKGYYYLPSDLKRCKYVSISVPSGYEIPADNGIASGYYSRLEYSNKVNERNFVLKKRKSLLTGFVYLAISDPQVKNAKHVERFNTETVPDIKETVSKFAGKEIYGNVLGDIVFDVMNLFPIYKASVSSLGLTMFHTIGNHDLDSAYNDLNNTPDPLQNYGEQIYESYFGPADYSFNVGNVHIITMKDIDYFRGRKYTERLTAPQLEWLKKDLSYVKEGTLVFLNLHAPTSNKTGNSGGNIKNATELMEILKNYRVHIFAGHTHFYENQEVSSNIYEHNIGAACGAWWAGHVNRCGAPNGYLVVEVNNNDVKWHYKATGKSSDYQFRVYKPGEFLSQPDFLVVNAWDWDPSCKVNCYEDGLLKGNMEQFADEDQDYITMNKSAKGYHTNHLFRVKPTVGVKKIKIEFVNRFGEVYSQELLF